MPDGIHLNSEALEGRTVFSNLLCGVHFPDEESFRAVAFSSLGLPRLSLMALLLANLIWMLFSFFSLFFFSPLLLRVSGVTPENVRRNVV